MLFWFSHCYCYCFCFCFCCCNWYCTIVMLLMLLLSLSLLIKSGKSKMIENNTGINHHLHIIVEELFIIVVIKLTLLKCKYCNIVDDDIHCRSCWNIDNVFYFLLFLLLLLFVFKNTSYKKNTDNLYNKINCCISSNM